MVNVMQYHMLASQGSPGDLSCAVTETAGFREVFAELQRPPPGGNGCTVYPILYFSLATLGYMLYLPRRNAASTSISILGKRHLSKGVRNIKEEGSRDESVVKNLFYQVHPAMPRLALSLVIPLFVHLWMKTCERTQDRCPTPLKT